MNRNRWLPLALAGLFLSASAGFADMEWGGVLATGRTHNVRLVLGAVTEFEGMVSETTRKVYDVTGETWKQDDAERYDTSDFDLEDTYGAIGLSYDVAWRFLRLQIDTLFLNPTTDTVAKRDYYLSIDDDISYKGASYDHLQIPEGEPFSAELLGNKTELTLLFVPVGFQIGDSLILNPSFAFGVLLFGGQYDIDAGDPSGVVQYQNPPEDFVVGGSASGLVGIGAPQWGPGVEIRFGQTGGIAFDLQVHYLFSQYDGSTSWLTTADHRDKNLEFDHENLRFRGQFEFPAGQKVWTLGVQIQMVDTDGTVTSDSSNPDEILARRERFDKDFSFKMTSVLATVGLAF